MPLGVVGIVSVQLFHEDPLFILLRRSSLPQLVDAFLSIGFISRLDHGQLNHLCKILVKVEMLLLSLDIGM